MLYAFKCLFKSAKDDCPSSGTPSSAMSGSDYPGSGEQKVSLFLPEPLYCTETKQLCTFHLGSREADVPDGIGAVSGFLPLAGRFSGICGYHRCLSAHPIISLLAKVPSVCSGRLSL